MNDKTHDNCKVEQGKSIGDTHHDQRRGVWCAMCHLVEPCTLLFDVTLITVALQHRLTNCTASRSTTPCGILEACFQTMPALDWGRRRSHVWNGQWPT